MNQNSLLNTALEYVNQGYSVIPLRGKVPPKGFEWKRYQERKASAKEVEAYFTDYPELTGIGIVTGKISGITVLDFDRKSKGEETYRKLRAEHGDFPKTPTVKTGGGGRHLYFKYPAVSISNKVGVLQGLDVRSDGGYVVAPPSVHPHTSTAYQWKDGYSLEDCPVAEIPEWVLRHLAPEPECPVHTSSPERKHFAEEFPSGQRNDLLYRLACWYRRCGLAGGDLLQALAVANDAKCRPPLDDQEVRQIAESAESQAAEHEYRLTDTGNAERLAEQHVDVLRYCETWKDWVVWNGEKWTRGKETLVYQLAKQTVQEMYGTAGLLSHDQKRRELVEWALSSESANKMRGMVSLAKNEAILQIEPARFDQDDYLLCVKNGVIDLRTGRLREHARQDYITRQVPYLYTPDAECPVWEGFIRFLTQNHEDCMRYLQKAVGYSLTASTDEQCFFFLYGGGKNGKSTFLDTIRWLLGDYGKTAPASTFMEKRSEATNDLAMLDGARIVTAMEPKPNAKIDEALLKNFTGDGEVSARFLYAEYKGFRPTGKIWIGANMKPTVRGVDNGIWRRVHFVPFLEQVPPGQQIRNFARRLLESEASGILAWAVRGCLIWQQEGLTLPERYREATQEYRDENDPVKAFLDECCALEDGQKVSSKDLNRAYREWCDENSEYALSPKALGTILTAKGFQRKKSNGEHLWLGIGLETAEDPDWG